MGKAIFIYLALAIFIGEVFSQKFILPTYRPPTRPRRPILRRVRDVNDEPLWLNQGDIPRAPSTAEHPVLPPYIDDVKLDPNRRYARSAESIQDEGELVETPYYRVARDVNDEPLWLNQGDIPRAPSTADHPVLPPNIDDVKIDPLREHLRYARSYSTPSRGGHRASGTSRGGNRGHDTGATHPGYNRRNARSIRKESWYLPGLPTLPPFKPKPRPFIPYISNRKLYA